MWKLKLNAKDQTNLYVSPVDIATYILATSTLGVNSLAHKEAVIAGVINTFLAMRDYISICYAEARFMIAKDTNGTLANGHRDE